MNDSALYRVLIGVSNVLLEDGGVERRFGCYATRVINADSRYEAVRRALASVRNDMAAVARNVAHDEIRVAVEELSEITRDAAGGDSSTGATWYPEE